MPTEADYRLADEWLAPYLDIRAMPSRGIARERLAEKLAQAREQALEEAAQRCDRLGTDYTIPVSADNWSAGCRGCAGRIRALKEEH